jgi:hypothetical protein
LFLSSSHKTAAAAASGEDENDAQTRKLLALAAAFLTPLTVGFLAAVLHLERAAKSADVADAIEAGRPADTVILLLGLGPYSNQPAGPFAALRSALRDAIDEAGEALTAFVPPAVPPAGLPIKAAFDRLDAQTVRFVNDYETGLIRQLADDTRAAVRLILGQPGSTANKGRALREVIGLTERQAAAVQSFRAALERGDARNALGRELRDRRHDRSVARIGEKPLSAEQIDRMVKRYRERYIKHRAESIAKTESVRAANAGNREAWRQAAAAGIVAGTLVRGFWLVKDDEALCGRCEPIPDLNPDGRRLGELFDTPFDGQVQSGPLHTRCRCLVRYRIVQA